MLYLIIGDNKPEISKFTSKLKNDAATKGRSIQQFSPDKRVQAKEDTPQGGTGKYTSVEVKDILNSSGMFSTGNSVFIYANKAENLDFDQDFLNLIKVDNNNDLIILDEGINKLTAIYKNIKKNAQVKEFTLPRDYRNFNISDAVFIEANKQRAITLIHEIDNLENEAPLVVAILYMGLRNFVSVKYNNKTANQLHSFVKQKSSSSKYNPKDIKKVYMDLLELDVKIKTNSASKRDSIDDFMLYSI